MEGKTIFIKYIVKDLPAITVLKEKCVEGMTIFIEYVVKDLPAITVL